MKAQVLRTSAGIALLTAGLSLVPYLGLLAYVRFGMHGTEKLSAVPADIFLGALAVVGTILPCLGVVVLVRNLIKETGHFQLRLLVKAYVCLILIFASSYALLQASSIEAAFSGMPIVWGTDDPGTFSDHVGRLHRVYFECLYLSVITITTVGYGDLTPVSIGAKLLTASEGLAGVGFGGLALGHYFSSVVARRQNDSNDADSNPS